MGVVRLHLRPRGGSSSLPFFPESLKVESLKATKELGIGLAEPPTENEKLDTEAAPLRREGLDHCKSSQYQDREPARSQPCGFSLAVRRR